MMRKLKNELGIKFQHLRDFADLCTLPSKWGKLDPHALDDNRFKKDTLTSFASTLLTLVPIIHMFLEAFVQCVSPQVVRCFTRLHHICGLLKAGSENAVHYADTLRRLIKLHQDEFVEIYGDVLKPKWHHIFHVPDNMVFVGRALSCFATERKHKGIKRSALYIFRDMEHTVLHDVVTKSFEQLQSGHDLFKKEFLVNPYSVAVADNALQRSTSAVLVTGEACKGDIALFTSGEAGRILAFWQAPGETVAIEVDIYENVQGDVRLISEDHATRRFIESGSMVDTCIWYYDSPKVIRLSLPPVILFKLDNSG